MGSKNIFNNESEWAKIEQEGLNQKNQKGYKIISGDISIFDKNNIDDVEIDPIQEIEEASIEPDDILDTTNDTSSDLNFEEQVSPGEYDDVLQLTEYVGGGLVSNENTDFVVAEYDKIDVVNIDKAQQQTAKKFVSKITKFILDFNDVKLTKAHEDYIKQVGQLQLSNLTDLLTLVEVNKQMISNIVARVNAVQAEDYAIINAYNNLINQHIKLIKEASNLYKSIPNVMKKMRADVLSNQELEAANDDNELITEEYGDKQFNNSKQMLKSILEKRKQQKDLPK